MEGVGEPTLGELMGGEGGSPADSLSVSVIGPSIFATAVKSMGGGCSVTALPSTSVAGVEFGGVGRPEWDSTEVTLVTVVQAITFVVLVTAAG